MGDFPDSVMPAASYSEFLDTLRTIARDISMEDGKLGAEFLIKLSEKRGEKAVMNFLERYEDHHASEATCAQYDMPPPKFRLLGYEKSILSGILPEYNKDNDKIFTRRDWIKAGGAGVAAALATAGAAAYLVTDEKLSAPKQAIKYIKYTGIPSLATIGIACKTFAGVVTAPNEEEREAARKTLGDFMWDLSYSLIDASRDLEKQGKTFPSR